MLRCVPLLLLLPACENAHGTCDGISGLEEAGRRVEHEGHVVSIELHNGNADTATVIDGWFVAGPPFTYSIDLPTSMPADGSSALVVQATPGDEEFYSGTMVLEITACNWTLFQQINVELGLAASDDHDTGAL